MLSPEEILILYDHVLRTEEFFHSISHARIIKAIQNMIESYKPIGTNFVQPEPYFVANYNNPAYRCAYLHKFAPLHTCLVQETFLMALTECSILQNNMFSRNERLKICSLGGGPGTDIIGIISACQPFGLLPCSAHVIDLMSGWKVTFNSIVDELRLGSYGNLSLNLTEEYFDCSFIAANLLKGIDSEIQADIRCADLITMVKFISAATCKDTEGMLKTIFNNMKPGALVFFIDNAAGGFSQMISRLTKECDLITIFGPLKHFQYTRPAFNVLRYGFVSCFETRVTVKILMKSSHSIYFNPQSSKKQSQTSEVTNKDRCATATSYCELPDLNFLTALLDSVFFKNIIVILLFITIIYYYL